MSDDPKNRKEPPPRGVPDDLNESDRAMLTATSHRQRDNTPLSLDQERLLDGWIAGALSSKDADRAVELTKHNKMAAERILERRLIAAANEGPDVPAALSARILRTSRIGNDADRVVSPERNSRASRPPKPGRGGLFDLRWPTFSAWQWSGFGSAVAAIAVIAVLGFQAWQMQLRSNQSFQIAMVTIEDRSVLLEGSSYRTRGRKQQPITSDASSGQQPTESYFRDMEVPTALLRRAISGASTDKGELEYSELMSYLRAQDDSFGRDARIVIDSALADIVSKNLPERTSTQIRAYDLNDQRAVAIRGKIGTLPANAQAILLTLRR